MNAYTSSSYTPRAPKPAYPYQQPSSYDLMLAAQSTSTLSSSTPPLVARSLASTPSSSALPDIESVRGDPSDEAEILYATGLDRLDLNGDEPNRWRGEILSKTASPQGKRHPSSYVPNPHASPYIPTIVRRRAAADPVNCGIEPHQSQTWQPHRDWLRPFRAGSVASYNGVRRGYARDIVSAGPWDTAIMSELAARFVERVAEGCSETLPCVARLASEVHECFRQHMGESVATSFVELLKQHLLSEFRAWWLSALPSSVANIPACSPSPPHVAPFRNVSSAIAIATFVGDLFSENLIKGSFVQLCLNMILDKLSVLEEVEALHAIVLHSGERLYDRVPLSDFLAALQVRCANAPLVSVVGKMSVFQDVQHHVQAIATLIESWAAARATPAPSEFSEPATEYSDYNPEHTVHLHTQHEDTSSLASTPSETSSSDAEDSDKAEPVTPPLEEPALAVPASAETQRPSEKRWADVVKA